MMKLSDRLPDKITLNGKRYRLMPDFRNVLLMMETLERDDLIPEARTYQALRHVVKHPPRDDRQCTELMAEVKKTFFPDAKGKGGKRLTSFEQDADLIRGAFRQEYGIDLYRESLHWLEFSCLLGCLPEGSRYTDIIGIRARPMPKATRYNADERKRLAEAKATYAIRLSDKEREKNLQASMRRTAQSLLDLAKRGEQSGRRASGI